MELKQIIRCPYCDAEHMCILEEGEGDFTEICSPLKGDSCHKVFLLKWKIDIDYLGYKIYTETQGLKDSSVNAKETL